jgi:hypothetical protein
MIKEKLSCKFGIHDWLYEPKENGKLCRYCANCYRFEQQLTENKKFYHTLRGI